MYFRRGRTTIVSSSLDGFPITPSGTVNRSKKGGQTPLRDSCARSRISSLRFCRNLGTLFLPAEKESEEEMCWNNWVGEIKSVFSKKSLPIRNGVRNPGSGNQCVFSRRLPSLFLEVCGRVSTDLQHFCNPFRHRSSSEKERFLNQAFRRFAVSIRHRPERTENKRVGQIQGTPCKSEIAPAPRTYRTRTHTGSTTRTPVGIILQCNTEDPTEHSSPSPAHRPAHQWRSRSVRSHSSGLLCPHPTR